MCGFRAVVDYVLGLHEKHGCVSSEGVLTGGDRGRPITHSLQGKARMWMSGECNASLSFEGLQPLNHTDKSHFSIAPYFL